MRYFYSALFYLVIPFITLRLLWRSLKAPDYRKRWSERFGFYQKPVEPGVIWLHAVSVGEAEAAFPLIRKIQHRYPTAKLLITSTTPTGSARVMATLGNSVQHVYLPYDTPDVVDRFMMAFKPKLAIIMETEIWPNLFFACGENHIPLYLINARLSARSANGYQKLPSLVHQVLAQIQQIAVQTQDDAERFRSIGATPAQISLAGNIKYDLEIPESVIAEGAQLKQEYFKARYIWLAASTHQGEELIFLEAYQLLKANIPELLLIIVPRHPERFNDVAALCLKEKLALVTRTSNQPCQPDTDIYLADTMGELKMLYASADVSFVGGSMVPIGGHNILEPLYIGIPVLFGPHMSNFKEVANKVLTHAAAIQCRDREAIVTAIQSVYSDTKYRQALIDHGKAFVQMNRGAIDKVFEMLQKELN